MHKLIKYSPEEKEQRPGPGNYENKALEYVKKEATFKMGTGPRFDSLEAKQKEFQ